MSDPRPSRIGRLADAIDVYLAHRAAPGDAEALLSEHAPLRDLLEPLLRPRVAAAEEPAPARLGDFAIVRELGRGGMGVVYEAVEAGLGRRVALKVLPASAALSARAIERFRREAAVLAKVRHPGVVPIYRVGELDGTHYFAMEFVAGQSLGQILERLQSEQRAGASDSSLTLGVSDAIGYFAEVAAVVEQAAQALSAAHAQGVLHRDVKPHNILLDADGQVRLVDFGLAKDLDRGSISRSGEVAGTPHYMSPEQARGARDLDGRTDVFALGVVLYELLTRQLPFDGATPHLVLRAIETKEPLAPRRVDARVPRDLETICLKALEKDVQLRYPTCTALAEDLARFRSLQPIAARPPGTVTRIVKLVRRHRTASIAALLAVLGLVVGPLTFVAVVRGKDAEMARQQELAQASFTRARRVVEQQLVRVEQLAKQPGMELLHRQLAEDALAYYREFLDQPNVDRAFIRDALDVQLLVGRIHQQLGERARARDDFTAVLTRTDALGDGEHADPHLALLRLHALRHRAEILGDAGDLSGADADFAAAAALAERFMTHTDAALGDQFALAHARALTTRGTAAVTRSERLDRAEQHLQAACALWRSKPSLAVLDGAASDFVAALRELGVLQRLTADYAAAEATLLEALRRAEAGAPDRDPLARCGLAQVCLELATLCSGQARVPDFERHQGRAQTLCEALVADFPRVPTYQRMLAAVLRVTAEDAWGRRNYPGGLELARKARGLVFALHEADPDNPTLAADYATCEMLVGKIGQHIWSSTEVIAYWDDLLPRMRALCARMPDVDKLRSALAAMLGNYANWGISKRDYARVKQLTLEGVALSRAVLDASPRVARYVHTLTVMQMHLARAQVWLGEDDALATLRDVATRRADSGSVLGEVAELLVIRAERAGAIGRESGEGPAWHDEPAAIAIRGLQLDPTRAAVWRRNPTMRRLEVREDYRTALDRAAAAAGK